MSLHFLFRDENHMVKALADPKVFEAIRDMIDQTVQGMHVIGLGTQGLRNMYSKKEIQKIEDIKGVKMRVQATVTEDATFNAYGAQTVHMPFGSVYTSLQTGVVDGGENSRQRLPHQQALRACARALDDRSTKRTTPCSGSATSSGRASATNRKSGCWKQADDVTHARAEEGLRA